MKVWRHNWTRSARRCREADAIIVSLGKSGRTWIRVFLCAYFCALAKREFTVRPRELKAGGIPGLVFTHDLGGYKTARKLKHRITGKHLIPPLESRTKPILLLARDPRDIVVSIFFQLTRRSRRYHGTLGEMIRDPRFGIEAMVDVLNAWLAEWSGRDRFKLIRYEDCRADPDRAFRGVLEFLGVRKIDEPAFAHALEFSSFENMKRLEASGRFKTKILKPGNAGDPESFKTRRGVVGGFKDYLAPEEIRYLDDALSRLDRRYGYGAKRA